MNEVNWTYRARLDRVVDGDTVILVVDNGFHNREHHSFRLRDVEAPEIFTKDTVEKVKGMTIKFAVIEWFNKVKACGEEAEFPLIITTQKDKQTFNRYIADISCTCGDWLNETIRQQIEELS